MNTKVIAIDLAHDIFELAISTTPGKIESRQRLNRTKLIAFMIQQLPAHIVMEACGTAHYWAREWSALGHHVTLLPGQHTQAYRRGNKTDRNDAAGLLEAYRCDAIKPVPIKSVEQQTLQTLHRIREQWKKTRVERINLLKAICREHGIEYEDGTEKFLKAFCSYLTAPDLTALRPLLTTLLEEIRALEAHIRTTEKELQQLTRQHVAIQDIQAVPGVGLLTSTALVAAVGDPSYFKNGRQLSAWLGITPRENSSGTTRRLGSITRRGDAYLRTLFIHGARAALISAQRIAKLHPDKLTRLQQWALALSTRIGHNKATVALANKNVRIVWALWKHHRQYRAELAAA